jgi:AcrR family transcriptional regulator
MRERILKTVERSFYARGIRAVSVDTIASEVGISKRTLYNHFSSKDDLIVAYLARRLIPIAVSDRPPTEQILGSFDQLEQSLTDDGFHGCPFVNAVIELKDPTHAANGIALAFKDQRCTWFRELLGRMEIADPESLATQLMLLLDGAIAAMLIRRDPKMARAARDAARVLLAARGAVSLAISAKSEQLLKRSPGDAYQGSKRRFIRGGRS